MKRACYLLLCAALLLVGCGADPAAAGDLKIVGPDQVAVNAESRYTVEGLTLPPDNATMADLQAWAGRLVMIVDAPAGAEATTDEEISLGVGGVRLRVYLRPSAAGVYVIVLVDPTGDDGPQLATRRVVAGQAVPGPNPPQPPPVDPPGPQAAVKAVILYESTNTSLTLQRTFLRIRADSALSPKVQILDQDARTSAELPHATVQAALQARAGKPLPLLAWYDAAGSLVLVDSLPADPDAALTLLRETL